MVKKDDKPTQIAQKEEILPAPEVFKPEADVTELQTTDLTEGSGVQAKSGDTLVMKYYGTLASDGTMFDENYTKDTSFSFKLGGGQVIQGWDQGLVGMKVGGERRLVIPSTLAYGEAGQGAIPANSDLVFVVKLIRIQK
ncbi:FKBP-type peptidyl-prolyl cis-trans isomerase [Candidatus Saccharibacteria bacterium]|nr:MAG: FKBP-type peptidyl-prolyl cis-trans isomerase [Candidatus Saccharibacteria bacterium]